MFGLCKYSPLYLSKEMKSILSSLSPMLQYMSICPSVSLSICPSVCLFVCSHSSSFFLSFICPTIMDTHGTKMFRHSAILPFPEPPPPTPPPRFSECINRNHNHTHTHRHCSFHWVQRHIVAGMDSWMVQMIRSQREK